ncbi:polysaccharide pyruvyl transferase family protein [Salinibacter ruber]|uniref:polysaccharide pyruvyl transferase family protein n=1 Tax=Salinibacter ruber TaxID=146919 RepID=UPI00160A817B|nr:polysaccharide pyruvyl transferase family protein [Salinibacter ruber]
MQRSGDVEYLSGELQTRKEPVGFTLPEWVAKRVRQRRSRYWWAQAYVELESLFGARFDYLDLDPEMSRRNILNSLDNEHVRDLHGAVRRHDTIVVDGNGDMIFKEDPRRSLLADLAVVELADYFDKEVYYVNSIFADCPITGRNEELAAQCLKTLEKCDAVAFRDPRSLELFREMSGREDARCIPDSLFHWYDALKDSRSHLPENGDAIVPFPRERDAYFGTLDFSGDYICVTGGSRAAFSRQRAYEGYSELVERLKELDPPVYLVPTGVGDHFLYDVAEETGTAIVPTEVPILMGGAILANARLFVTGRYHPSIMAAAGGTPCVFLGADSHKTRSLQRMLGYDRPHIFSAIPPPDEHDNILARGLELLGGGRAVRRRIQAEAEVRAEEATNLATLVNGTGDAS